MELLFELGHQRFFVLRFSNPLPRIEVLEYASCHPQQYHLLFLFLGKVDSNQVAQKQLMQEHPLVEIQLQIVINHL